MPEIVWPSCPRCRAAYTVTVGLPVVITAGGLASGRFVDAEIDREIVLDESATIACDCGTDEEWTPEQYEEAAEALAEPIAALIAAEQVTATYDLRARG